MKNLGVFSILLVITSAAFADGKQLNDKDEKLNLAFTELVTSESMLPFPKPTVEIKPEVNLDAVNAKLARKLELKLDALLADQLQSLQQP